MTQEIQLVEVTSPDHYQLASTLFQEYAVQVQAPACFQNFEYELTNLHIEYAPPNGCIFLAYSQQGLIAGCGAVRLLQECNYTNACEMKRLYVKSEFRGQGIGRLLAESIIAFARDTGYDHLLLDTLDEMETARELYHDLGFIEIEPYYHNPVLGAHYLMVPLQK